MNQYWIVKAANYKLEKSPKICIPTTNQKQNNFLKMFKQFVIYIYFKYI